MKRLVCVLALCLVAFASVSEGAGLDIDISQSALSIKNGTTIRVAHIAFPGYPDLKAWVDFTWDGNTLTFIPIDAGIEPPLTGRTWAINVMDSGGDRIEYKLTSHPETRTFDLQMTHLSGSGGFFYCYSEDYVQNNSQFGLRTYLSSPSLTDAKLTFATAFSGCGDIYPGQTIQGTITMIPDWFDFTKPFMLTITAKPWTFNPDGSKQQAP